MRLLMSQNDNQSDKDIASKSNLDSDESHLLKGRLETIGWDNITLSTTVFPELEQQAKDTIERCLGYLPSLHHTISFEPYIRSLIHQFRHGQITKTAFYQEIQELVKLVRNTEMESQSLVYSDDLFERYNSTFEHFGLAARNRVIRFLGYEPELQYSLVAELCLRKVLATDILPDCITSMDYMIMTMIKYREILFSEGKIAADSSPLIPKCNNIS